MRPCISLVTLLCLLDTTPFWALRLEYLHNINDSLVYYWQWLTEISTVPVHSGASSSCIWTSYYTQCQRFLLFVRVLFQQGLSTELCKDVITICVIFLIILVTFTFYTHVQYMSTTSNNKHMYCATLQYVWHHLVHNTPQWNTYTQSLFARHVLRHFTYWHWFSLILCVSRPENNSYLLFWSYEVSIHSPWMKIKPYHDSYSSFFNVALYLYIPFGLELSSSFQNLPISERIDELKKL